MSYGWNIEKVDGGFIVTKAEAAYQMAYAGSTIHNPPKRYVFRSLEDLLDFLKDALK